MLQTFLGKIFLFGFHVIGNIKMFLKSVVLHGKMKNEWKFSTRELYSVLESYLYNYKEMDITI